MFVKSAGDWYFPADPVAVWSNLSTEFQFQTVPGGHRDMVRRNFENLAAVLTHYVSQALCEETTPDSPQEQIRCHIETNEPPPESPHIAGTSSRSTS